MNLRKALALAGLLGWLAVHLFLPAAPVQAEIYRWQDAQGHWHFSDSPPSDAVITQPPDPEQVGPADRSAEPAGIVDRPSENTGQSNSIVQAQQEGLLWRIRVNGKADSFLLGTIHSSDARVTDLRPVVAEALDQSQRFVMEMEMDASAIMAFGTSMMLTDGRDLESLLGATLYQRVQKAMGDYGMPPSMVRQLKPWVVMALLSMPRPDGGIILDLVLHQRAAAAGKPTAGLETAEEQLAVFEQLSMEDQIDLLKMTLDQLPALPKLMEQLIQAYAANDLKKIAGLAAGYENQGNLAALKRFTFRLNDQRNLRMVQRMAPYLQQGGAFVAVGALHLAGPKGIVQLLRQRGYPIEPVP